MSITGFASVPAKFAREQGYYCNNICFDVFVKCFLLGGVCGRDVWNKGDMLYRQKVLEFKVDRVRYTEQETAEKTEGWKTKTKQKRKPTKRKRKRK